MTIQLCDDVLRIENYIIEKRRWFHQFPELGFEEVNTSQTIAEELRSFGLEVKTNVGKTGVVGLLRGNSSKKCIALRADMDALPIQEKNDISYKSKKDGVMHACGHDGHMAMLLGAAKIVSENRESLRGSVKFIFQPAEEGDGGARFMIEDGVLEDPHVDEIYGAHLWNYQPYGTMGVKEGPILASADRFTLTVIGKGGHGATPHTSVDAIVVASHLITQLQTIVSRNINPLESSVVTIGTIQGGYNFNVIADEVVLRGTARAYTEENRQMIIKRIREIVKGVAISFNATIEVDYEDGYPITMNTIEEVKKLSLAAGEIVGDGVQFPYLSMGGEDMSYYLQKVPGCFFFVGSSPEKILIPHHSPNFDIDERALLVGSSIFVKLVLNELSNGN